MNLINKDFLYELFPRSEYSINAFLVANIGDNIEQFRNGDIYVGSITCAHTFSASFKGTPYFIQPRSMSNMNYYLPSSNSSSIAMFDHVNVSIHTSFIGYKITKK